MGKSYQERGVFICDEEAKNIYTNKAYQEMTGCTREELLGLGWTSCIHPKDLPSVWSQALRLYSRNSEMENRHEIQCEFRLMHRDGSFIWANCQPVDMSGFSGVGTFVGILEDISWRKEAEESLRQSEERFLLAMQGSHDGLWDWDMVTDKVFYSRRYMQMLGMEAEESNGNFSVFESRIHPEHHNAVITSLGEYLSAHGLDSHPFEVETPLQMKNGTYLWFRMRGQALWDRNGTAIRMAGSITNITERRNWEEEQARLIASLADARDKAETTAKARSEFLAVMSHEIRTPLNGVIGMASILLDTASTPEQQECLETIRISGECLLSIINDILDLSKIDAGKLNLTPVPCNLRNLVEDVGSLLALRGEAEGVEMVVHYRSALSAVFVDAVRLRQVLINLVGNACKFTHKGYIAVDVSIVCSTCHQEFFLGQKQYQKEISDRVFFPKEFNKSSSHCGEEEQLSPIQMPHQMLQWFRFSVIDTGIGIPADTLGLLFEKFTQCSTTGTYGGTGLGLAVSKKLVELMGGSIGVESTEGIGSKFTFIIPLELDPSAEQGHRAPTNDLCNEEAHEEEVHSVAKADRLPKFAEQRRVLVVDHHEMTKEVVCEQIRAWGMESRACNNVSEAVTILKQSTHVNQPIHIAIVDSTIVENFGQEMEQARAELPALKGPQLIMLGHVGQSLPSQPVLAELGCCACFNRPTRQAYLRNALAVALAGIPTTLALPHCTLNTANGKEAVKGEDSPRSLTSASQSTVHKSRVLLVEDNKVNQMVAVRLLNTLGCTVTVACNGIEALSILECPSTYDIIFMDCHMPGMDGFETARLLRQENHASHTVPIVALTAATSEGEVEKCIASGMDDYISKPVTKAILQRALDRWVGQETCCMTAGTDLLP
ncbi:unnamed protein product [Sphagnum jensenii]|uniref:LOV domain-containing protein n=1 Tax=Sphagnum jensenii TaxID=128206 RepID=A0ABP1B9U8_9BRYO